MGESSQEEEAITSKQDGLHARVEIAAGSKIPPFLSWPLATRDTDVLI